MPIVNRPIVKPVVNRPPIAKPTMPTTGSGVRPPAKPAAPAKPAKAAKTEGEKATKSLSIRMPGGTLEMLDNAVASYESDRTEVVKRAIRLQNSALSGHNAVLIITDANGQSKEHHIVIDGVPV